jgi:hypothetical protein
MESEMAGKARHSFFTDHKACVSPDVTRTVTDELLQQQQKQLPLPLLQLLLLLLQLLLHH